MKNIGKGLRRVAEGMLISYFGFMPFASLTIGVWCLIEVGALSGWKAILSFVLSSGLIVAAFVLFYLYSYFLDED